LRYPAVRGYSVSEEAVTDELLTLSHYVRVCCVLTPTVYLLLWERPYLQIARLAVDMNIHGYIHMCISHLGRTVDISVDM